ncbi:MAG: type II toxin-antitoxin system VapC family toxin [Nanoarchaeota archaeon]
MYILDTSAVIDVLRGRMEIKDKITSLTNVHDQLGVTYLTLCELYRGIYLANRPEKDLAVLHEFMKCITGSFGFDAHVCEFYGQLYARNKKKGKTMQDLDLMIASIVMMNEAVLVTRDRGFKSIEGLRVELW